MRKLLKFLHSVGAVGLMGGLAAYMIVLATAPASASIEAQAELRASLALVSGWLLVPSMAIVALSGLLAIAAHTAYADAPWVWLKAATVIFVAQASLVHIDGPAQRAAELTAQAAAGEIDPAIVVARLEDPWAAWWMLMFVYCANIALAIWRPRFGLRNHRRREKSQAGSSGRPANR